MKQAVGERNAVRHAAERTLAAIVCSMSLIAALLHAEDTMPAQVPTARPRVGLAGTWQYQFVNKPGDAPKGAWQETIKVGSKMKPLVLPGTVKLPIKPSKAEGVWFQRQVEIPAASALGARNTSAILTKKVRGKTKSLYVPVDTVETVQQWGDEHRRVKRLLKEISELSEKIIRAHVPSRRANARNRAAADRVKDGEEVADEDLYTSWLGARTVNGTHGPFYRKPHTDEDIS